MSKSKLTLEFEAIKLDFLIQFGTSPASYAMIDRIEKFGGNCYESGIAKATNRAQSSKEIARNDLLDRLSEIS